MRITILFALGIMACGIYLGLHRAHRQVAIAPALATAPELSLTDLNGNALRSANYKDKVVLVNFWAAWCKPCAEEVPQFIALQKKYQDQGLQVIGFSVEDDATELRGFLSQIPDELSRCSQRSQNSRRLRRRSGLAYNFCDRTRWPHPRQA